MRAEPPPTASDDAGQIATSTSAQDETELLAALRAGDADAFRLLVDRYHLGMIRLAQQYVPDRSAAEGCVQEAWLGVLRGLDQFEARSSLKTWIFSIALNCARARARRDRRTSKARPGHSRRSHGRRPYRMHGPDSQ